MAHTWVTLKGIYLLLNQNNCVTEMVKGQRARLEVVGSNPSERYRLFYPVPKARAIGTTFGVPVQETGTKEQSQPVSMAMLTGWSRWSLQSVDETADSSSFPIHSSPGFRVIRSLHRGRMNAKHLLVLVITKVHHSLWFFFPRIPHNWQEYI